METRRDRRELLKTMLGAAAAGAASLTRPRRAQAQPVKWSA
jgi:hypothetical protein